MHMESALTDIDGKIGRDVKEVYVGPSALWIAKLIPRQVSFSQGWFWTTTEICHEGRSDGLAFRQRPDGNGIDVRCPHPGLLSRRGDGRAGDGDGAVHPEGIRANRQTG